MNILIVNFGNPYHKIDSFGPLLGSMLLTEDFEDNVSVLGTLKDPLFTMQHYYIARDYIERSNYDLVIVTDAAMSRPEDQFQLLIKHGGVHPGRGTYKAASTKYLGDIGILFAIGDESNVSTLMQSDVSKAVTAAIEELHELVKQIKEGNLEIKKDCHEYV